MHKTRRRKNIIVTKYKPNGRMWISKASGREAISGFESCYPKMCPLFPIFADWRYPSKEGGGWGGVR